jgi:signal transduction histidine kinase
MMSKCWFARLFGAWLLAVAMTAVAQNASNWRVYRSSDGLPETMMSSVSVGAHGNIWVKHLNAELVGCVDGYDVKTIPSPGPGINRVYESASGQIWTLAPDGLQQYKDGGWVRYVVPEIRDELGRNSIFHLIPLYPAKQNHVLFLIPDALMEFNGDDPNRIQTITLRLASETGLKRFSSMAVARDGGLWISGSNGVAKLPGPARNLKRDTEWQEHLFDARLQIQNLREPAEDDEGGVTALAETIEGRKQVAARFNGRDWAIQTLPAEKIVRAWRGANKTWWAMTTYSLFQWRDGQNDATVNEEVSAHRYYDLAVEPEGVFWLATSDGLFRYAPLPWQSPADAQNLKSPINTITEDREDGLWVASPSALHRYFNNRWEEHSFPSGMAGDSQGPRGLFALTNGAVVVDTGERLWQFNPAANEFSPISGQSGVKLKPLGLLKDGKLCVQVLNPAAAEEPYDIQVYDGKNFNPFPYSKPGAEVGKELVFLFASQSGRLWLAGNKGIGFYDDKEWHLCGIAGKAIPDGPVCMVEITEGRIWCGIQDEIWEYDGKIWSNLRGGFDRVNMLAKEHDGSVWVATDNGVYHHYRGAWIPNGGPEGLPGSVVRAVYADHSGRIWAGTTRGLTLRHPEADTDAPKTYVRNLGDPQDTIEEGLPVNISFGARDKWKFTPAERLLFSYRLDDKEWSPYQEERTISFSDLIPAKHYFKVRSMDRSGNVDPKPAALEFAITLPWYKESRLLWISFAGLAVALFFAAVAFNRHLRLMRSYAEVEAKVALRTQELAIANQELLHSQKMNALGTLAAGIAHDFNNILSIIKGSAQIIEDNPADVEKIHTRTGRIKTVVEQGAGIVEAMLGFSGSDKQIGLCNVNAVIRDTVQLLGDRFRREVKVALGPSVHLPQVQASKDFIQQILLNFIFNAAEAMTERREVIVGAHESKVLPSLLALAPAVAPSYVFVSVQDFGSGIASEIMPRIFEPFFTTKAMSARRGTGLGLSMAYQLARQMEAGLAVESAVGKGSKFTLIIPVRDLPVDASQEKG